MTQVEALTAALLLAIAAPTSEQSNRSLDLAEELVDGLTPQQIEDCKYAAIALWI
jgi:predicted glycosyltransferase